MTSENNAKEKLRKPTAITGLRIAEYLAKSPRGARLGDIAAALEMDSGQAHRIIVAMMEDGWVMSVSSDGHYAPTARVIGLGATAAKLELTDHAQPFLDDLFQKTGESAFLGELRDDLVVCVGRRIADRPLQVWIEVGKSWPLEGTAVGAAILAARHVRLGHADSRAKVAPAVTQALEHGYARDSGQYRDGVESFAAVIRNASGSELGAIAIGVPAARVGERDIARFGSLVRVAGAGISERLGWIDGNALTPAPGVKARSQVAKARVAASGR